MTDDFGQRVKRALNSLVIEGYIARGRKHADRSTEDLKQNWPEAFRKWADDRSKENREAEEDISGELLLRGIETDTRDVPEAHEKIVAEIKARGRSEDIPDHPLLTEIMNKMVEEPH